MIRTMYRPEYHKQWHANNRERRNAAAAARYAANPARPAELARAGYWRLKVAAFELLGGVCVNCGEDSLLLLSLNHVNGRNTGWRDRDKRTHDVARKILTGVLDKADFDLRCHNCQVLYEYERGTRQLPAGDEFESLRDELALLQRVA